MNLLDTDTLTLLMAGQERLLRNVEKANGVAISIVTRIEILRGRFDTVLKAADSTELLRAQHWLRRNEEFMSDLDLVFFDTRAGAEFDKLRKNSKVKRIGRADLLIASIALASGATLVTRNVKHFRLVPNLKLENWAD